MCRYLKFSHTEYLLFFFVGLVVDQFSQRLFWADFELSVIGSVLFDGSDSVVSVSTKQGKKWFPAILLDVEAMKAKSIHN